MKFIELNIPIKYHRLYFTKQFLIIFPFAFLLMQCNNNPVSTSPVPAIEGRTYKNPIVGLSITTPQGWSITMGDTAYGLIVSMQTLSGYPNLNVITAKDNIISGDSATIILTMNAVCNAYATSFSQIIVQPTKSIVKIGNELVGEVLFEGIPKNDTETYHYYQLLLFHRSYYFAITYTDIAAQFSSNSQYYDELKNSISFY